ncbi:acyltransferase family protein [Dyella japonica]|uniref:Acyltransferase n=1 Tax=Dyella japonica A8 TaxID=1217721 RepID=A0A075K552_9GAMM|nr:acyltransferase [Dyella japonica]AIF49289.1 acyltransferase [Dyella japonica A8]
MGAMPNDVGLRRNAGIDLLRGLSILLVVLHHIGLRIKLRKTELVSLFPEKLLNALNFNGYEAVFIFFVISGFLITSNALRRSGSLANIDLRTFYARRFSRIAPCLVLLVLVLSVLHLLGVQDYVVQREGQSLPRAIVAALGFHLNWYEGMTGYLPGGWDVLWSLSIEEVFYLGFPIVCLLTRRTWVLAPMLLVLAVSLPWTRAALADNEIWQEKAYLPGMAAIATGVLGALLAQRWRTVLPHVASALGVAGAVGLYLVMFEGKLLWQMMHNGYMLLLTGSALCLVLASAWAPVGRTPWRGLDWLRSWGRLSYEIYLTHMFVVFGIVRVYRAMGSDIAHGYLWYLPALPLCWMLGRAVERCISLPAEQRLRARMLPVPAVSAVPA